ncbi:MAG: DUF3047 domain-containing protein [Candidatus Omnitrophota bacterium]
MIFFAVTTPVGILIYKHLAREIPKYTTAIVKFFPFTQENSLKEWEEKMFKGKVVYRIESAEGLSYVKAASKASASALYYKVKLDVKGRHPLVSWKWNVEKFPVKKNREGLTTKDELDFAGRVYVIFPANFLLNSKVLEYVWAENIPAETIGTSPYSKNIKLIVARSGANPDKEWYAEERDVLEDYRKAFGKAPEHDIGAVAFMTNTEHTGTDAVAMYDDIRLGYKEDGTRGGELFEKTIYKN